MAGVNKVILVGNLGKDPEVRHLESGASVANFSLATTETYKDRNTGERKDVTEWHNIVLWRGLADVAEKYIKKGDQIYVEGKLRTRSWEKDGVTRYTTEIVGENMTMLGKKPNGQQQATSTPDSPAINMQDTAATPADTGQADVTADDASDDLPF